MHSQLLWHIPFQLARSKLAKKPEMCLFRDLSICQLFFCDRPTEVKCRPFLLFLRKTLFPPLEIFFLLQIREKPRKARKTSSSSSSFQSFGVKICPPPPPWPFQRSFKKDPPGDKSQSQLEGFSSREVKRLFFTDFDGHDFTRII